MRNKCTSSQKENLYLRVLERWDAQYTDNDKILQDGKRVKDIRDKLSSLDLLTCTEQDIHDIIGNDSWTMIVCDECKNKVNKAAIIDVHNGESSDYICYNCLKYAIYELESLKEEKF